jgi:hypothetical protein
VYGPSKAKPTSRRRIYSIHTVDCRDYQSVCPFVRIGSPPRSSYSLPPKLVCLPLDPKGGNNIRLRVRGWGDPIRTTDRKLGTLYVYSMLLVILEMYLPPDWSAASKENRREVKDMSNIHSFIPTLTPRILAIF